MTRSDTQGTASDDGASHAQARESAAAAVQHASPGIGVPPGDPAGPGLRALQSLLAEQDREIGSLTAINLRLEGEQHARDARLLQLERDLAAWKSRWQDLAVELETMALGARADQARSAELSAQLVESSAALAGARSEAAAAESARASLLAERDGQRAELAALHEDRDALAALVSATGAEVEALQGSLEALGRELEASRTERADAARLDELEARCDALARERDTLVEAERAAAARIAALAEMLATAELGRQKAEQSEAELEARMAEQLERARQQHAQLKERSTLARKLEGDLKTSEARRQELEGERQVLVDERERALRHAQEQTEFAVQLGERLERHKELLRELEGELAGAHNREAETVRRLEAERDASRARTAEASARREDSFGAVAANPVAAEAAPTVVAQSEAPESGTSEPGTSETGVVREGSLASRLQVLEGPQADVLGDDLTQIRGIGARLAEDLYRRGITRYDQIAGLELRDLEAPDHALADYRERIIRDGWVMQANGLLRP